MAFYAIWFALSTTIAAAKNQMPSASFKIHQRMNIGELKSTFHVEHHEDVPEYDIVRFHSIGKREAGSGGGRGDFSGNVTKGNAKYAERYVKLSAFGKKHRLYLIPSRKLFKGNLKMWTADPDGNGSISYTELPDTYVGDPYQDEKNQAALLLHEDAQDGSLLMEGTIGGDLVIKPLPAGVRKLMKEKLAHSSEDGQNFNKKKFNAKDEDKMLRNEGVATTYDPKDASLTLHHQHVVYRRNSNYDGHSSDFAFMEAGDRVGRRKDYKTRRRKRSVVKREAPYIIYPEILVIVDYDGYRLHGGDNVQVKRYFVSFWNGVDLRYKLLKGPKVRISIAGLIISRGRDATPYLERNRVGRDAVDSAAALTDMGKYLFRERRLPVYDIAVAVTKISTLPGNLGPGQRAWQTHVFSPTFSVDIVPKSSLWRRKVLTFPQSAPSLSVNQGPGPCSTKLQVYKSQAQDCGPENNCFAYVGGACVVNKRLEKVNSVAIIEDTGGFSGIIVAAHEVGHLLGAVHDGSPPPTYLGGPGAEKCRWEDGFIMSDLRHSEKGFKWSPCSVASFHHFLNGDTATCLFNSPHEDESLPRVLPGKLLTLDAQCRRDRGTSACFKDERVCSQLFCFDSGSGYCVAYRPAAEGSPCGDGQSCGNGICIPEHENIIPDYSQNSATYIRRQDYDNGTRRYVKAFRDLATRRRILRFHVRIGIPGHIGYGYGHGPGSQYCAFVDYETSQTICLPVTH